MVRIAINAGHGLNTPGKRTPEGELEWKFNDIVARWVTHNLKAYEDVEVTRLDDATGRVDVPLKERTDRGNQWKADSLVSIHHNALTGVWGTHTGTETYIYHGSKKGMELAQAIHPELVKRFKLKDRGIKQQNFHMLRESNMPAILTEGGYMDSRIDIVAMRDEDRLRAQADGITAGLVKYHKLKKKAAPAPIKPQPEVVKQVAKDYYQVGDRGEGVKKLQADYNKVGYKLVVDGIFGKATESATEDFQRRHKLAVDGVAGKNTLAKLADVLKPKSQETLYSVTVDGKQVGAFGEHKNVEFQVASALKSGKKKIVIEQV